MQKKNTAIIVLGSGKGERFGSLKQFVRFNKKPLLARVVDTALGYNLAKTVVLVVPHNKVVLTKRMYQEVAEVVVLPGGQSRFESTKIALDYLDSHTFRFVFIHDAVRPFVRKADFLNLKKAMLSEETEGAILYVPVTDSVVVVDQTNNQIEHLNNSLLRATQTPHLYRYESLVGAFVSANKEVENAELMETAGHKLSYVPGLRTNIKLTYKNDVVVFKQWLS